MPALLLTIAATSKVPFFIIGGAFAVWAVILSAIGLTRPQFPGSRREARGVMGVSLTMIVLAIGAAVVTS